MDEQNILTGDISRLNQIHSDIKTYTEIKEKLESTTQEVKELGRTINVSEKAIKDEIETTLKKRRDNVVSGFVKEIQTDEDKIKKIQADKNKAKIKGVKERISVETSSLKEDNEKLMSEIKEVLKREKMPKICSNRLFKALFITKGIKDVLLGMLVFVLVFLALPSAIYYYIPNHSGWNLIVIYFAIIVVFLVPYKLINDRVKTPYYNQIKEIIGIKDEIHENKKEIKKIRRSIQKDQNEEIYGLEGYNKRIEKLHKDIAKINLKKISALEEFEKSVKPNIISEIDKKDRKRLESMKEDLKKKTAGLEEIEKLAKEQRIYITSNYEAYLGNHFIVPEKLEELAAIMKEGKAKTIGQAIQVYNNSKK